MALTEMKPNHKLQIYNNIYIKKENKSTTYMIFNANHSKPPKVEITIFLVKGYYNLKGHEGGGG
jgi:hypothetical protein